MYQTYDPSRPIIYLFKKMQDGRAYAQEGQQPYGTHQIINIAYALIFNTGVYGDAWKECEKQNILNKNWENFKANFTTEHLLYRKQIHTTQATSYHAANHAHYGLHDALLIEQSEALIMMETASATYRRTMSDLVTCNAQLRTNLAEKSSSLAAANEIIRNQRSVSRTNGGGVHLVPHFLQATHALRSVEQQEYALRPTMTINVGPTDNRFMRTKPAYPVLDALKSIRS
jgi:hypothetical protein